MGWTGSGVDRERVGWNYGSLLLNQWKIWETLGKGNGDSFPFSLGRSGEGNLRSVEIKFKSMKIYKTVLEAVFSFYSLGEK